MRCRYATRVNTELQRAGVRGLTIIDSSGDGGVGGTQPDNKCKRHRDRHAVQRQRTQ
jgi:hypothetical protein